MTERIPLLAFTLSGPMGHFRKPYSTTSALTYPFPPPTTLIGTIAGLLGYPRDTYYEELTSETLWLAVRMLTPVRIQTLTVNYLFTKGGMLYDKGRGTQIPMGWVFPAPPARRIRYRIYVSSPDPGLWERLVEIFRRRTFHWPPYLGITEALAWVEPDVWVGEVAYQTSEEAVSVVTPMIRDPRIAIHLEAQKVRLLLDRFPLDLRSTPYRNPRETVDILYEERGKPFRVQLPYPMFEIPDKGERDGPPWFGVFLRKAGAA